MTLEAECAGKNKVERPYCAAKHDSKALHCSWNEKQAHADNEKLEPICFNASAKVSNTLNSTHITALFCFADLHRLLVEQEALEGGVPYAWPHGRRQQGRAPRSPDER